MKDGVMKCRVEDVTYAQSDDHPRLTIHSDEQDEMGGSIRRVIESHFDKGDVVIVTEARYEILMDAERERDDLREALTGTDIG